MGTLKKLLLLKNIQIDRCLIPSCGFEDIVVSLHHFSDASELGYGQCSYFRLVTRDNKIQCCLKIGKTRVSAGKFIFMPRMELTTAVLSVRVANELKRELSLSVDREIFWTDSQVALGYIKNETKKLKFFVANRVQFIQDNTKKSHRCEEGGAHFLAFIDELEKEIII